MAPALDDFPDLQVRSAEEKRVRDESSGALPRRPFSFTEQKLSWGGKRPRGSRERAPVNIQFEPKDNYEEALQQLPSNFAINFEARIA